MQRSMREWNSGSEGSTVLEKVWTMFWQRLNNPQRVHYLRPLGEKKSLGIEKEFFRSHKILGVGYYCSLTAALCVSSFFIFALWDNIYRVLSMHGACWIFHCMIVVTVVIIVLSNLKILSLHCLSSPYYEEIMGLWNEWWIENKPT